MPVTRLEPHRTLRLSGLKLADWGVRILLGLTFLAAGGAKIASVPALVVAFEEIGAGQWLRWLVGTLEIAGGLMVLVPRASVPGAILLACVMVGATFTNVFLIRGSTLPPLALLAASLLAVWLRLRRGAVQTHLPSSRTA